MQLYQYIFAEILKNDIVDVEPHTLDNFKDDNLSSSLNVENDLDSYGHRDDLKANIKHHNSIPLEILNTYKTFHSHEVLINEYESQNGIYDRTFVVGFYSCPNLAGNRLHEFFNSMILAVAHNYTILWKFYDTSTCRATGQGRPKLWCDRIVNTIEICDELVSRAPWLASYDEWAEKLDLPFGERSNMKEFLSPVDRNGNQVWIPTERVTTLEKSRMANHIKKPVAKKR